MTVAIVYDTGSPITTGVYFHRAFQELGFDVDAFDHSRVENIPEGYNLYFIVDSGPIYDIPKWKGGITFYYGIDTHLDFEARFKMAQTAQFPIMAQLTCGAQRAVNRGLDTLWVPLGCDPWIHQDHGIERDLDVAFVGHLYEDDTWRTTIKAKLLANGFTEDKIFVGQATKEEMAKIYSRAKIVLNHSVRDNKQDINMRVFEAMSSGAFLITQKLDHEDMDRIIPKGLYTSYINDEELFKAIKETLEKWDQYEPIAQQGKLFVRSHHTYTAHLKTLLTKIIGEQ